MSSILDFFGASPARIQALAIGALAMIAMILALVAVALWYRGAAYQARGERDVGLKNVEIVSAAAKACSSSVELAKKVGTEQLAIARGLLAEARRLHSGDRVTVAHIDALLSQATPPGAGCDRGNDELEADYRKRTAGAPPR